MIASNTTPYTYSDSMQLFFGSQINNNSNDYGSPLMGTPFLESSQVLSPFADPIGDRSPYAMFASFSDSPTSTHSIATSTNSYYQHHGAQQTVNDDIYIAGYLDKPNFFQQQQEQMAVKNFNGDQTLLILDKSKLPVPNAAVSTATAVTSESKLVSPTVRLNTITEEDLDTFLFPPLTSSQEAYFEVPYEMKNPLEEEEGEEERSLGELLSYTDSPLSQPIEDEEEEEARKEEVQETKKSSSEQTTTTTTGKRKISSCQEEVSSTTTQYKKRKNSNKKVNHNKEKKYECEICGLVSKRKYNLTTHIKTHDKNRVKEFGCDQCSKSFDRRHDRDRHLATVHRRERSFGCSDCKAHFSRGDALNRHLVLKHDYDEHDFED